MVVLDSAATGWRRNDRAGWGERRIQGGSDGKTDYKKGRNIKASRGRTTVMRDDGDSKNSRIFIYLLLVTVMTVMFFF